MNLHILMSARTWVTKELRADRNRTGVLIVTSETKKKQVNNVYGQKNHCGFVETIIRNKRGSLNLENSFVKLILV